MTRALFVVSKQPFARRHDGETVVTRLLLEAAAATCSVHVVALTEEPARLGCAVHVTEVPKPKLRLGRLALASAARRRSLIHARFAPAALARALEDAPADVVVARRVYMAQAAIDAGRTAPRDRLVVLVDVLESMVLRQRRSALRPLLALEARRTRRDELRCLRSASDVAYFSETESSELRGAIRPPHRRLDLVLAPAPQPAPLAEPVALFVGDRRWIPNAEALDRLLALWPRILRMAPRARLLIVGRPAAGERPVHAANVERLGFVDDLAAVWREASVLLAPVSIGGGVRVKVLDAARHGVPVVGTPPAVGSTARYLPLTARASDDAFAEDAAELLGDQRLRRSRGEALYEVNRALARRGFVEGQLATLLAGPAAPAGSRRDAAAEGGG